MKVRIIRKPPVADFHGVTEGKVFEVVDVAEEVRRHGVKWWVIGDTGEKVGPLLHEAVEVED